VRGRAKTLAAVGTAHAELNFHPALLAAQTRRIRTPPGIFTVMKTDALTATAASSLLAEHYLTKPQLAGALARTIRTIDRMMLHGDGPPATRIGRTTLFRRDAVLEWLRSRETPVRTGRKRRGGGR
jgi:hypothetical protein